MRFGTATAVQATRCLDSARAYGDVIMGGYPTRYQPAPTLLGDTILNRVGARGHQIAHTCLIVSPQGEILDFGGKNLSLTDAYPSNAAVQTLAQAAEDESDRLAKETAAGRQQPAAEERLH